LLHGISSSIGASKLVRLLGGWSPVDSDAGGPDVAERMSTWFGPLDAIRLQAVHQAVRVGSAGDARREKASGKQVDAVAQDVQRVRGVLSKAISQDPLALANLKPADEGFGYASYQQRHFELQRQMGQMLGALRDHVRQAVSRISPRLRQLAVLDAAFEELLAEREQALLPTTAALLERRFHQLRSTHRQEQDAAGEPDDPAQWRQPGGWLHTFEQDWRQALLAELELRLEPVAGLVDALRNESGIQKA
jgi:Protein of unknown function (DUF3348)